MFGKAFIGAAIGFVLAVALGITSFVFNFYGMQSEFVRLLAAIFTFLAAWVSVGFILAAIIGPSISKKIDQNFKNLDRRGNW